MFMLIFSSKKKIQIKSSLYSQPLSGITSERRPSSRLCSKLYTTRLQ